VLLVEIACVLIVALYVMLRLRRVAAPAPVLERLLILAACAFAGEDSVIRVYHFYGYSREWHLFVDRVPLLIVLIWPVVIDSAWVLAHRLAGGCRRFIPLVAGALVLADASLIEPIAVRAGLWSWSEPGLFAVPLVGILGWALFTIAAVASIERMRALAIVTAPLATHALLVSSWWGGLRWLGNHPIDPWHGVVVAWALAIPIAAIVWMRRLRDRIDARELVARLPGALFFFVLLAAQPARGWALQVYALAFVPPWLALWRRT
jgi:hypothetical protein